VTIVASKTVRAAAGVAPTEVMSVGEVFSLDRRTLTEDEFGRQLEKLGAWKRRHMPILTMPQGAEVLIWLLEGGVRVRPLKDLYRGSRFSEPTVRWVLKALVDDGFISMEKSADDLRVRNIRVNPKLAAAVADYLVHLQGCAVVPAPIPAPQRELRGAMAA
jgi:DNA-binding MarR family transcriptional regulator